MKDFKFLKVQGENGAWGQIYVKDTPWVGSMAFSVKGGVSTDIPVNNGTYKFNDGRIMEIKDGRVESLKSHFEIVMEEKMESINKEFVDMKNKFEALTEAIVELAKSKSNG